MNLAFQIILTAIGAFLSVILTGFLIQNGRAVAELGKRFDERTVKIAELIVSEGEKTREILRSIAEGLRPS